MSIRKKLSFIKQTLLIANRIPVSLAHKAKAVVDYLSLYHLKGLTQDEYIDFEFWKRSNEFRSSFLGLNEQRYYLDYLNPIKYYILSRNKYIAHKILEKTGIRKTEFLCYYQPEGRIIESRCIANNLSDVLLILRTKEVRQCVIKSTESSHGDNVWVVNSIDYLDGDCELHLYNDSTTRLSEVLDRSPLLFESVVKQTQQMASLNESSVNTVRFMTALYPDNKARLIATFIKIGRAGTCVDNAGSGGNVDACVNMQTGELEHVIQFDGWGNVTNIQNHPDSGNQLGGVKINNWQHIVNEVLHFQECFPYIKIAGWDIAITDDGPVVIEVNDFWDRTGQYFIRRGWREEIRDCYLAWKRSGNKYPMERQPNMLDVKKLHKIARIHE